MTDEIQSQHYDKEQVQESEGTLLRAPNGALYFIPYDKLDAFQIPEDKAFLAEKLLFHQNDLHLISTLRGPVVRDSLGLRAGNETTTVVVDLSAIRRWQP